jgi:hypothetical protein
MKDKAWSGLYKIPAEEVIKELRLELGKSNAYISELEEKIELYESEQHILKSKKDNRYILSYKSKAGAELAGKFIDYDLSVFFREIIGKSQGGYFVPESN